MIDTTESGLDRRPRRSRPTTITRRARARRTAPTQPAAAPPRRTAPRVLLSALVMTFAAGLVATLALPSYAFNPAQTVDPDAPGAQSVGVHGDQRFTADGELTTAPLDRDAFSATSSAALVRRAYAQQFSAYDGPSAADYLKDPAHPAFSLDAVYSTASQYRGVPYVFGGADPSGFDCSGFVMFVYAQYGVNLPHSVHMQDAIGTPIAPEDAQPGDVVVFNDEAHDGFYAGNGMILHAPYPGARVRVQPLWTGAVHFVRFGI